MTPPVEPEKPGILDRLRARYHWFDHVMRAQERYQDSKGDFYAAGATVRLFDADGREVDRYRSEETEHGLHRQAAEAARCIGAGLLESPVVPLADTLAVMAAMDDARAQVGVSYPGE